MKTKNSLFLTGFALAVLTASPMARAHCDSLDGPVIQTAKAALNKGDVTPVLKWVRDEDEAAIRAAFTQTLAVRKLSPAAASLADMYFYESLVRLHRAGEGESFTGLKPAGSAEPALVAADLALESGSVARLEEELLQRIAAGLKQRFERVQTAKPRAEHNVEAGRAYIAAYVDFIHYFESLHATAERSTSGHVAHQH